MHFCRRLVEKSWSGKVKGEVEAWRRCLPRDGGRGGDVVQAEVAAAEVFGMSVEAESAAANVAWD